MDYGIIDKQNKDLIINRSKVRQECEKERCNNQNLQTCSAVQALYFDRKKRQFINHKKLWYVTHVVKEEHIILVAELDSNYVGHFTPTMEKLKTILRDSRILSLL